MSDNQNASPLSDEEIAEIEAGLQEVPPGPYPPIWESCDCGDGYPCSHGSWIDALHFPIAQEGNTYDPHRYNEIQEFPQATAEMFANAEPNLRRLIFTARYYHDLSQTLTAKMGEAHPSLSRILGTHDAMVKALWAQVKTLKAELAANEEKREDLYFRLHGERFDRRILHDRMCWAIGEAAGKDGRDLAREIAQKAIQLLGTDDDQEPEEDEH